MKLQKGKELPMPYYRVLVYGMSGVGKTYFARTCPNVLLADADNGKESVRGSDVSIVTIDSWDEGRLQKDRDSISLQGLWSHLKTGKIEGYDTLFIDGATGLQRMAKRYVTGGPDIPMQQQDWGTLLAKFEMLFDEIKLLPMHVIVTAQAGLKDVEDSEGKKKTLYYPDMSGKMGLQIGYFFDIVAYFFTHIDPDGKVSHKVLTQQSETITAKDRTQKLKRIEEPNFKNWLDKIQKGK